MKKLYLIRHAKSSWADLMLDDFNRPLNKRGKESAKVMGSLFKNKSIKPDLIISSPAYRAKKTAIILAKKIGYDPKDIKFDENIYDAFGDTLKDIVRNIKDKNDSVFLLGHNPGFNFLALDLVDFNENIVTCGIVEIDFDVNSWKDISSENASLVSYEYPKKYQSFN